MIFGQKIEKNNNAGNEFLGINSHENMIFRKKIFLQVAEAPPFFKAVKKRSHNSTSKDRVKVFNLI